jgi:hypothetical protein
MEPAGATGGTGRERPRPEPDPSRRTWEVAAPELTDSRFYWTCPVSVPPVFLDPGPVFRLPFSVSRFSVVPFPSQARH